MSTNSLVARRIRQFLVHSYLYYVLDDSIIPDHQYDEICKELLSLVKENPSSCVPYFSLVEGLESSGSGYYIQDYPPAIQTTAFRLLWLHKKQNAKHFNEDFSHFISRWGRTLKEG